MNETDKEQIAKRAYEKFLQRGSVHGHHDRDWLEAEKEVGESKVKTDGNYKDNNRMIQDRGPPGHRHGGR
jgi:hypothetical protein